MPWFYQRPNLLVRYGEGGATPPSFTITESGGTIKNQTLFTVNYAPGGFTALAPTSVAIILPDTSRVESTSINVVSDNQLTAVFGIASPGTYTMEICP